MVNFSVKAAAGPVEKALSQEGFTMQRENRTSELAEIFPGLGKELAGIRQSCQDLPVVPPSRPH
jgi:hypothetical protein